MKRPYLLITTMVVLFIAVSISGCKKDSNLNSLPTSQSNLVKNLSDSMVMTPKGLIPESHVFLIEDGYHLEIQNDRVLKVDNKTLNTVRDLAAIVHPSIVFTNNSPLVSSKNLSLKKANGPTGSVDNYQAYANWQNTSGNPINYFSATWTVPSNPTNAYGNDYFYIFNALTPAEFGPEIMQPVLQWGKALNGGGAYWSIANWYGWEDASGNTYFAVTSSITVTAGTAITGSITYNGDIGGYQNYTCAFSGSSGQYGNVLTIAKGDQYAGFKNGNTTPISVTIPTTVSVQTWAWVAIEGYNHNSTNSGNDVSLPQDYPSDLNVKMKNIKLLINNSPASSLKWDAETGVWAYWGQSATEVSNDASGSGEVDLYFHPNPNINLSGSVNWDNGNGSGSGTITADPGKLVHVTVSAYGPGTLTNFTMSGAQLSGPMGDSIYIQNNSTTQTFTMPASGSVTWSGYFTRSGSSGTGDIAVY